VRITLTSVLVDDQDKALRFYTEIPPPSPSRQCS
jgi:hypothetical protein